MGQRQRGPVTLTMAVGGEPARHGFASHEVEVETQKLAPVSVAAVLRETDGAPLPGGPVVVGEFAEGAD